MKVYGTDIEVYDISNLETFDGCLYHIAQLKCHLKKIVELKNNGSTIDQYIVEKLKTVHSTLEQKIPQTKIESFWAHIISAGFISVPAISAYCCDIQAGPPWVYSILVALAAGTGLAVPAMISIGFAEEAAEKKSDMKACKKTIEYLLG